MANIRTRFAPSPTGYLHIGGLRTAAYAYALAKHEDGKFILRIEDTDQKRFVEGATEKIYDILKQFNLNWDEGPFLQSERVSSGIYQQATEKLLSEGHAYYCFCKPRSREEIAESHTKTLEFRNPCRHLTSEEIETKLKNGEKPAIRLKVPDNEVVGFTDFVIRKKTTWQTNFVDDAMLLKSDGFPTYHLAMPVDDHDMQITHVIRAVEWLPSTPVHILLFKYLGFDLPEIGHPTAILDPEGGKLSKRKGNVSVEQFLEAGYLPEALLNFVILLGWAPKDNQEMFTLEEFVKKFDINGFQKSNPRFNTAKLLWFNGQYIRLKSNAELFDLLKNFPEFPSDTELVKKIIPLAKERMSLLKDFFTLTKFFFEKPLVPDELLPLKKYLSEVESVLHDVDWTKEAIEEKLLELVESLGYHRGEFFMSLRLCICGARVTPPLTESMLILGRDQVIGRVQNALK